MDKFFRTLTKFLNKPTVSVFGISIGFGVVIVLLSLYRHQKRHTSGQSTVNNNKVDNTTLDKKSSKNILSNGSVGNRGSSPMRKFPRHNHLSMSDRTTTKSQLTMTEASSVSNVSDLSTTLTLTEIESTPQAQDLCDIGMDTLQTAIECWEDALSQLKFYSHEQSLDGAELGEQLKHLLEMSYHIQDEYERRCVRHADHLAIDSAIAAITEVDSRRRNTMSETDTSTDQESFVSAVDLANLSDLETHREMFQHLGFYEAGLTELKYGQIPCRMLRTQMTGCLSDTEFFAKLYCIRQATMYMLKGEQSRLWFITATREIFSSILIKSNKDCQLFVTAYNDMIMYLEDKDNHQQIRRELVGRGVKCISFYDVALDFLIMDAFDDLDSPPSSVIAISNNRWLSDGFKESALNTAVWSVLKAKRALLKEPDGFIARFYQISEHISPVLAWGLLGPDSSVKPICLHFKRLVEDFIRDIFSFENVRYTTLEQTAEDILTCARKTHTAAMAYMT